MSDDQGALEMEADRLVAALIAAEKAVKDPGLLAALDVNARGYAEARRTWGADLKCGDLLPEDHAMVQASRDRYDALLRMVTIILRAGEVPDDWDVTGATPFNEYDALALAARALHTLTRTSDDLMEHVAESLGEPRGPRYVLGY